MKMRTYIIKKYSSYQYDYGLKCKYDNVKLDDLHLSLDTPEDYELMKNIFKYVYKNNTHFDLDDVLTYISSATPNKT